MTWPAAEVAAAVSLEADGSINLDFRTVLAAALCLFAAAVSSAGGLGGGSLFVPILTLVARLSLRQATEFSAFMVAGSSVSHVLCTVLRRSKQHGIDYDIAVLSQPCLLLGVSLGVICNVVLPEWLATLLFALVVAFSAVKTCQTGVRRWKIESEDAKATVNGIENGAVTEPLLKATGIQEDPDGVSTRISVRSLLVLLVVWVCFFLIQVTSADKKGKFFIKVRPCSAIYWAVTTSQVPLAVLFTAYALHEKKQADEQQEVTSHAGEAKGAVVATQAKHGNVSRSFIPVAALLAGVLGGLFGIGGGLLINPTLMHMGIHPQVAAATCSFMMLFSSSMTSVQYLLLGTVGAGGMHALLVLAVACAAASAIGVILLQRCVQKLGRASLIVFIVGTVMVLGTASMTCLGAVDVWTEYRGRGKMAQMGLKPLC